MWTRGGRTRPSFFCWLSLGIVHSPLDKCVSQHALSRNVLENRILCSQKLITIRQCCKCPFCRIPFALLDVPQAASHSGFLGPFEGSKHNSDVGGAAVSFLGKSFFRQAGAAEVMPVVQRLLNCLLRALQAKESRIEDIFTSGKLDNFQPDRTGLDRIGMSIAHARVFPFNKLA